MGRNRFVLPETKTLHISDGDTVTVRKRLNTGQNRDLLDRMGEFTSEGKLRAHPLKIGLATVLAYLVDWTLQGPDGQRSRIEGLDRDQLTEVLDDLDLETFDEIREAIEKHMMEEKAVIELEKNERDGATGSSAISPSLVSVAGDTNGLLN